MPNTKRTSKSTGTEPDDEVLAGLLKTAAVLLAERGLVNLGKAKTGNIHIVLPADKWNVDITLKGKVEKSDAYYFVDT